MSSNVCTWRCITYPDEEMCSVYRLDSVGGYMQSSPSFSPSPPFSKSILCLGVPAGYGRTPEGPCRFHACCGPYCTWLPLIQVSEGEKRNIPFFSLTIWTVRSICSGCSVLLVGWGWRLLAERANAHQHGYIRLHTNAPRGPAIN